MERKVNKSSIMVTASVDDMQQEEKKRKWQDPNEDVKYVCDGGKVQCKYCSSPVAPIRVTTESVMLQDKPWATVGDNNGQVNFGFTGLCTHPKWGNNKPSCKSVISLGQWQDFSETVIGNHHALLVKSTIPCLISGEKLKIVHSGQTATLDVVNPLDKRKVLEDAYWIDGDEVRRDIPLNTIVGLYIKARNVYVGEEVHLIIKDGRGQEKPYNGKVIIFFMITLIKKHFCVIVVKIKEPDLFSQSVTVNDDIRHRTSIKARINKYELYSPRYGSKTNPIPVLDFDYNLREPRDQYDEEEYESLFSRSAYYKRAVELYLTYMMSKEEFKERFEKE